MGGFPENNWELTKHNSEMQKTVKLIQNGHGKQTSQFLLLNQGIVKLSWEISTF